MRDENHFTGDEACFGREIHAIPREMKSVPPEMTSVTGEIEKISSVFFRLYARKQSSITILLLLFSHQRINRPATGIRQPF